MNKNDIQAETIRARELKDRIAPGSIIFFNDPRTRRKADESGYNQYGVFLSNGKVIFRKPNWLGNKGKTRELSPEMLGDVIKVSCHPDISFVKKFCTYFEINRHNYNLFKLGMKKLTSNELIFFDCPEIMPEWDEIKFDNNKERWQGMYQIIKPGDVFFTFDPRSMISKLIAHLDGGSWSHVGRCLGGGLISEATTKGRIINDFEYYRKRKIHVGIYRQWSDLTEEQSLDLVAESLRRLGGKYNYIGALKCGFNTILGRDNWVVKGGDKFVVPTPNGMIYTGHFRLVDYI